MVVIMPNVVEEPTEPGNLKYDPNEAEAVDNVLYDLNSSSLHKCQKAVELISVMPEQRFRNTFFQEKMAQTLRSLASCLKTLSTDIFHCRMLLGTISDLELSDRDLADTELLSALEILSVVDTSSPTVMLARQIVGWELLEDPARPPLVPPFTIPRGTVNPQSKRKKMRKVTVRTYQTCIVCKEFCLEPDSAARTLYCHCCMRPAHRRCCPDVQLTHQDADNQGQIWCGFDCQYLHAASHYLARLTSQLGYLRLIDFSTSFPSTLGISVTAGSQYLSPAQASLILPAAIWLLPEFKKDSRHDGNVMLVDAFVMQQHPLWRFNNPLTLTLWALPSDQDHVELKDCIPMVTIIYRIQGKDVVDLLYAATDRDLRGCKLLQVAMLALQLHLHQMGVQRIFLDAASDPAKHVWTSNSLGFSVISESQYRVLAMQYSFVENSPVAARCLKVIPDRNALLTQLRNTAPAVPDDMFKVKQKRQGQLNKPILASHTCHSSIRQATKTLCQSSRSPPCPHENGG